MQAIQLTQISTTAPEKFDKKETKEKTATILEEIDELQNKLYAENKRSMLVILQGMDASGKDGVIRNVFGHLNPQGVRVESFKSPTDKELAHDFLWRIHQHAPQKGMIQIFNRSHYEDILITRVHNWCNDATARKRMKAINDFEELLQTHNDTLILKFYLHISQQEQADRLKERLEIRRKNWKHNEKDQQETKKWDIYMKMYEDCFAHCNAIPWTIVPSDKNWYKEFVIASVVLEAMKGLKLEYPELES